MNTLVYSMGPKADDIFQSFGLSNAKKYDVVKKKFDDHFVKRRNVIFERAEFNSRKQEDGESVESFITDVYSLGEHCGYGRLHDAGAPEAYLTRSGLTRPKRPCRGRGLSRDLCMRNASE